MNQLSIFKMLLAMFLGAFSLVVVSAASQLGNPVGYAGMLLGIAAFSYIIWDTLIKHIFQQRAKPFR
jgi:hypothetical protein